jgi:hypothetical protein
MDFPGSGLLEGKAEAAAEETEACPLLARED